MLYAVRGAGAVLQSVRLGVRCVCDAVWCGGDLGGDLGGDGVDKKDENVPSYSTLWVPVQN